MPVGPAPGGIPPEPSIVSLSKAVTMTLPALPRALVKLEISPLFTMDNVPAVTVTFPALPVPRVSETIPWSIEAAAPTDISIVTGPATVTETSPAFPSANAAVPRDAPESTVREPPTDTAIPPPGPAPVVAGEAGSGLQAAVAQEEASTFAPLCKASWPATIVIDPPVPMSDVVEKIPVDWSRAAPPSSTTEPAEIVIGPPLP